LEPAPQPNAATPGQWPFSRCRLPRPVVQFAHVVSIFRLGKLWRKCSTRAA
jgi:hypothetical protein